MEGRVPEYPTVQISSQEGKKQKSPNISIGIAYRYDDAVGLICDISVSRNFASTIMVEISGRPSEFHKVRKVAIRTKGMLIPSGLTTR